MRVAWVGVTMASSWAAAWTASVAFMSFLDRFLIVARLPAVVGLDFKLALARRRVVRVVGAVRIRRNML